MSWRWIGAVLRHRASSVAALLLGTLAATAVLAPWLAPYDPLALVGPALIGPSAEHWLGTDQLGRDVLSRLMHGARYSLTIAVLGVSMSVAAGTLLGLVAGYVGGVADAVIGRLTDAMFTLPDILLALVVIAVLGPGFDRIVLAIAIVYTPIVARVVRGSALRVRSQPYVEAARVVGVRPAGVIRKHVLPNVAGPLIVQTSLSLAFAVLAEAALSFLGMSGQPDAPSWGLMLRAGKDLMDLAWWVAVFPGLTITLTVLAFNLLGDGVREAIARHG
jgi:peptide/nickel transport system permease protein